MHKKNYTFSYFLKKTQLSNTRLVTTKKIISTICAIFFALLFATTIAFLVSCHLWDKKDYAQNYKNIWVTILTHGFAINLTNVDDQINTLNVVFKIMGILIISALAFIVAFKAGLFNMGVSGQMFAGAIAATFVGHKLALVSGLSQIVMLLASIVVATLVAIIIGALKVFLNVNEVVSSIMLNWFIYFNGIMLLNKNMAPDSSGLNTENLPQTFCINGNQQTSYIVVLFLAVICIIFVSIFLKFTVAGKKQVATGLSKTASIANGYNVKLNVIGAMAISGILSGILGCMVYCCHYDQMPITTIAKSIPQEGFNGIAVGLIAMNNPVACVPIAFFFALVQESARGLNDIGIDPNVPMVVFGIIVYGSAAITLFMNIKPYWLGIKIFKGKNYSVVKHNHNLTKVILMDVVNEQIMLLNKNYASYLNLTKPKGTLNVSFSNRIQIFFANIKNKICYWWLSKVKKIDDQQLRKHQYLNRLQNLRLNHTNRIAVIKTNSIQKEAYEKTSKWFKDSFGIQSITSLQDLKAIKHVFYHVFFIVEKEINNFYQNAYQVLKKNRHCSLDRLNIRYDETLIPKIYFENIREELRKVNIPSIFIPYKDSDKLLVSSK